MSIKPIAMALLISASTASVAQAEWTGGYVGITAGSLTELTYDNTTGIGGPDVDFEDANSYGGFFGGHISSGELVYGYEIAFEAFEDVSAFSGQATIDSALDLKFNVGVPAGQALLYGIIGFSNLSGDYGPNEIDATGFSYGAGAMVKLTDQLSIGGEYLVRSGTTEFVETDIDATANSFNARVAFHF